MIAEPGRTIRPVSAILPWGWMYAEEGGCMYTLLGGGGMIREPGAGGGGGMIREPGAGGGGGMIREPGAGGGCMIREPGAGGGGGMIREPGAGGGCMIRDPGGGGACWPCIWLRLMTMVGFEAWEIACGAIGGGAATIGGAPWTVSSFRSTPLPAPICTEPWLTGRGLAGFGT